MRTKSLTRRTSRSLLVRDSEPAGRGDRARPGQLSQHGRLDRPKLRWPSSRTHREGAAGGVHFRGVLRAEDYGQALARGAPYHLVHRGLKAQKGPSRLLAYRGIDYRAPRME